MTTPTVIPTRTRAFTATIKVHGKGGRRYHPNLEALRDVDASGVYAIIDAKSGFVLYVGESHTGRLFDTITRHFRAWTIEKSRDPQARRSGGTMYDRHTVKVALMLTAAHAAANTQFAEIQRLRPKDNFIDGGTVCCDEVPF